MDGILDDDLYLQYDLTLAISDWKFETSFSDCGTIIWHENDGAVLYNDEIYESAEILDDGFDTDNHDGATYSRVKFTRGSESKIYRA